MHLSFVFKPVCKLPVVDCSAILCCGVYTLQQTSWALVVKHLVLLHPTFGSQGRSIFLGGSPFVRIDRRDILQTAQLPDVDVPAAQRRAGAFIGYRDQVSKFGRRAPTLRCRSSVCFLEDQYLRHIRWPPSRQRPICVVIIALDTFHSSAPNFPFN
ncbi:hypothetical protein DENSPDRAFT_193623 [Dentipellis sp. KUC8613]|nr:hypothetical protein DENSPDRAFT_193623 [Dentipellis sp. KUC8613]